MKKRHVAPDRHPSLFEWVGPDGPQSEPVTATPAPARSADDEPVEVDAADHVPVVREIPVTVIRSPNRRRTISARMRAGVLEVLIPARASKSDEAQYVETMRARFARVHRSDSADLRDRSRRLARQYRLPEPTSVRWVSNMAHRWGSCSIGDGTIRVSDRLASMPDWVLDAVLVHELSHLEVPDHSSRFWELANRYPKMERARGYLLCVDSLADVDTD